MVSEERMTQIGSQIFLARGELGRDINLGPQPVRDGLIRFCPSMELSRDVSAHLNPHPTPAVVVDSVHIVVCVVGAVFFADHGVPGVGKVIPTPTTLREANENGT